MKNIYFPGLISIVGISLWFLIPKIYEKELVCIEITEPIHGEIDGIISCYSSSSIKLHKLNTSYFDLNNTGSTSLELVDKGFERLAAIIREKDSSSNVAFVVKNINYGTMISIYNHCLIQGINEFTVNRDTLFVLHERFAVNEPHSSVWRIDGQKNNEGLIYAPPRPLD